MDALNAFLRATKTAAVSTAPSAPRLILVIGNEAADLDSMVCAVSYALAVSFEREQERGKKNDDGPSVAVVPIISVPREDFALRTDAVWLFSQLGVDLDALVFADDLDPLALDAAGRLSELVLVDHNVPATPFQSLVPKVTRVVDHHEDESKYPPEAVVEIAPVGSCATLVTEAIAAAAAAAEAERGDKEDDEIEMNDDEKGRGNEKDKEEKAVASAPPSSSVSSLLQILAPGSPVAKLLTGAVLLDTQNLDPNATRATPRDAAAIKILAPAAGLRDDVEIEAFYQTLKRERFDQKGLSPRDLLRRDYKQWDMGGWQVGVSSYQVPLASMGPEAEVTAACDVFSTQRGLDLLVLMPSFDDEARGGAFTRQLAFVPVEGSGIENVVPGLVEALREGMGGLTPATEVEGPLAARAFYGGDPKASRKKVQPMLLEYLTREGIAKDR